ncbi:deoxyribonuclease-1-like [Gouania willdenowi]|uniref:deoxyribonuclease-1-like n=1 Tax=Gouania willdenowi TaxID=441366 RepID=UPI001055024A|nr:deoxyribonuclease-1-like [Gouania willdenowi]
MWWRSALLMWLFLMLRTSEGFTICSYNVQKLNSQKISNHRHTLTRLLSRCDVALLQHVSDPDGKVVRTLLNTLNKFDDFLYSSVSSDGLGKSPDLQKYVYIYRTGSVEVLDQYQYRGPSSFLRPPFVVQFRSNRTAIKKFFLVPLHSDPDQAKDEINGLYDVFQDVSRKWNNQTLCFLGDFHAACAYLTKSNRKDVRLFRNSSFSWLIGDKVDTTVSDDTSCAYDRMVVFGEPLLKAIIPRSAKVFDLSKEFKLSRTKVMSISENHPLMVKLKSSTLMLQATPLLLLLLSVIGWLSLSDQ